MADDLDTLLDEVEAKFCSNIALPQCKQEGHVGDHQQDKNKRPGETKQGATRRDDIDDIDTLLHEILDDDDKKIGPTISNSNKVTKGGKDSASQVAKRKCCPVFVGGSAIPHGVGTSNSKRACDQLRCISCDFRIASFDDYEWDSTCDYLFFRNNMPDCQRLRAKLKRSKGARAYACQCSWHTALAPTDLGAQTRLRWVCGTHPT